MPATGLGETRRVSVPKPWQPENRGFALECAYAPVHHHRYRLAVRIDSGLDNGTEPRRRNPDLPFFRRPALWPAALLCGHTNPARAPEIQGIDGGESGKGSGRESCPGSRRLSPPRRRTVARPQPPRLRRGPRRVPGRARLKQRRARSRTPVAGWRAVRCGDAGRGSGRQRPRRSCSLRPGRAWSAPIPASR